MPLSRNLNMLTDEVRYKLLMLLESNPTMSQRGAARELGVSLGKLNYCLKALVGKGWVKVTNFKNNQNKIAYMYLLTPRGIRAKGQVTMRFLQRKMEAYESLRVEIERLRGEADRQLKR
jgi:EPS-associated MarR family transcriptional regulator